MSKLSLRPALRARSSVMDAVSRTSFSQTRSFSVSASRQVSSVISFSPTSSPELDSILSEIRYKILLPTYIRQEQRKKIFRPRYKQELRSSPITMEIDGEIIKYTGLDPLTDIPNTREILDKAIERMDTKEDFENLPRLLEGLCYNANRKLKTHDYVKMTTTAGERGCIYTIIDCARQVRKTEFKLDKSEKVQLIMEYLQLKALNSEWGENEAKKALAWAEMVVEMADREEHLPKQTTKTSKRFPLSRDPQILSTPLFLAAGIAKHHNGGQDVDGKVAHYAKLVTTLWPAEKGLLQLHPEESYEDHEGMHYLAHKKDKLLEVGAPILYGMQLASQIVEEPLRSQLQSRADTLAGEVKDALAQLGPDQTDGLGVAVYKRLYEQDQSA
ncbi:hypothetical protein NKR23_g2172 [Pleurostoma richardsiae]|uniref:Uncharacterized protein n=1 Tax=Pleurostoma richardsiae TaxID=41990 RepID=A0AA38RMT6_9PEZI|nr:hypothetical protein NKR23_g2172 [Pleurostoma richardsiae]